ncbi:MAG: insulinase family protein [Armatimonadetes bacterium]|nr:insulinase family protein [Armatimonadota bacterium]
MSTIQEHRFDNGLILLVEELERPVAACHLLLPGGTSTDPAGLEGAGNVLATLVQRGAGTRDTKALSEAFEFLGYRRGVTAGQSSTVLTLAGLVEPWDEAIGLLADIVLRPALPESEVEPCRQLALQTLAGLDDEPGQKLIIELYQRYFPTAFGRCRLGTRAGLEALDHSALRRRWEQTYCPAGAVMTVAGGLRFAAVVDRVGELFGDWHGEATASPPPVTVGRPKYEHVDSTTEQVHLGLAYPDVPPDHPARYHALMAAQVLSGGMGSRLFTEVREKRGLCYSVHARTHAVRGHGYTMATAGTTTQRSSETLEVMARELLRLPGSVEPDEVQRGRVRLLSSTVMSDESTSARAARMATDHYLLGRVRSFEEIRAGIEAVTCDSLNQHLGTYPPQDFTVVTLGPSFTWPSGLEL